jgi:hypothetical protein
LASHLLRSWVSYYLARDPEGPTTGVWPEFAAPASALAEWSLPPRERGGGGARLQASAAGAGGCPLEFFLTYRRMRELGLPLGVDHRLDAVCSGVLRALWGAAGYARLAAAGRVAEPQLAALPQALGAGGGVAGAVGAASREAGSSASAGDGAAPVAAWRLEQLGRSGLDSDAAAVLAAAEGAFAWLGANLEAFPKMLEGAR